MSPFSELVDSIDAVSHKLTSGEYKTIMDSVCNLYKLNKEAALPPPSSGRIYPSDALPRVPMRYRWWHWISCFSYQTPD